MKTFKKSAIQISLSWLFMIIIGTFFFVFAYNFIGNYKSVEMVKSDLLLKQTIRTILNDVGRTNGIATDKIIALRDQLTKKSLFQNKKVEILCQNSLPIFSINGNLDSNNEFLKNYPTFMTIIDEKDVGTTYLVVENFKMPFKITNTLAFVSKKNLIIFDENSKISEKLLYKFRKSYSNLNYKSKSFSKLNLKELKNEIKDNSYSSIVFVSDIGVKIPFSLNDFDIYASQIQINEKGDLGEFGSFQINDNENKLPKKYEYLNLDEKLNIITMAIFSKMQTFDCSYKLLVNSIKPIYSFYIQKAQDFEDKNTQICSSLNSISQQKTKYKLLKNSLIDIKIKIESYTKIYNASNLYNLLRISNNYQLGLEDFNCPYIY